MKKTILLIATIFAATTIVVLSACDRSEQDFQKATEIGTVSVYDIFITDHPKSDLVDDARDSIVAIFERNEDLHSIANGIYDVVDYDAADRVRSILTQKVNALYNQAIVENSVNGWMSFLNDVPVRYQKDAQEILSELQWKDETTAWQMAANNDNQTSYEKYLELHPKGKHAKQAERKLIDIEVAAAFAGEHGILPQMDKGYSTGASYSVIEIENRTQYDLTVSYSGPDSKRMKISPYATRRMCIDNGNYRVAANVGHGVVPFAGTEYLDGSHFSSSFYIETRRY